MSPRSVSVASPPFAESSVPPRAVWALGNFDGVHAGHRALIQAAASACPGAETLAVTFEPHPVTVLKPGAPPFRLTLPDEKARLLQEAGARPVVIAFTEAFSRLSARAFVEELLIPARALAVAVGEGFRFGADRTGDADLLTEYAAEGAFQFIKSPLLTDATGTRVSSGRAREALKTGDAEGYLQLTGRPWSCEGEVTKGDARARTLGFPTANVPLPEMMLPPRLGVYAGRAEIDRGDGGVFPAVANIGVRPTFAGGGSGASVIIETHVLPPFSGGDLYGRTLRFYAERFLRPERRFDSVASLQAAMIRDAEQARVLIPTPRESEGAFHGE